MIVVEGVPGAGSTELAQRLALQYEAAGRPVELPMRGMRGHPLRRSFEADAYDSVEAFTEALVLQWHNFAIRAAAMEESWICADVWLEAPRALHTDGHLDAAGAIALGERLFDALAPLAPTLLYLSTAPGDAVGDGAFAGLEVHRTLLNGDRLDAREQTSEALAFLGEARHEIILDVGLGERLAGRYILAEGRVLELDAVADGLEVRGPVDALGPLPRSLLPAPDGRLLVAGMDLDLRARLDDAGRAIGLLARSTDPGLAAIPEFLPREGDS
jgi:hypothetical protein